MTAPLPDVYFDKMCGGTEDPWQLSTLAEVLRWECRRLAPDANIVAAHWRHPVADCPLTGDATAMSSSTCSTLARSVAARERLPGAR